MTNAEFEQATKEFFEQGGTVEILPYNGPKFTEKTFIQRGYVWANGRRNVNLKEQGIRK